MTITNTSRTAGPFLGTGLVSTYPFAFKVFLTTDVYVQFVSALGVLSSGVLGTDYSVSLNADQDSAPGGTVILTVPLASGVTLTLGSQVPITQTVVLTNPGAWYPKTVSDALDKLTILIQQALNSVVGAIRVPETGAVPVLPPAATRANQLLSFDSLGNPITVAPVAGTATALAILLATSAGAGQVGFASNSIGAAVRTMLTKGRDTISLFDFSGVDSTGVAECSAAWNAAFTATRANGAPVNAGKTLSIPAGTYKLSNVITVGTNQSVVFEPGVTIDASGLPNETTSLFSGSGQTGVYMDGNGALLKGARATAVIEGNSAAFFLYGCKNVDIRNFRIQDFATDGITITGDNAAAGACKNVVIYNCASNNNRRNAMSIISAIGCWVLGGAYTGSNGAPAGPFAGIDIEPNQNCFIQDVHLVGVYTANNLGAGIQFTPNGLSAVGAASNTYDVTVTGGRSFNDGTVNTVNKCGMLFTNGSDQTNAVYGQILVNGFIVESPMDRGVAFYNWNPDKCPRVVMNDCVVYDPDFTLSGAGNDNRTGYVITADATQAAASLGNITLRNCRAEDRRASPRMTRGFGLSTVLGKALKTILIIDPTSVNYTATLKADVYTDATAIAGGMTGVDIVYTTPRVTTISGSQSVASFMGCRLNATVSLSMTLPPAASCPGAHWEFQTDIGVNSVSVTPTAGDTIGWLVDVVSTALVLDNNAFVSLRSRGGTWIVEEVNGKVRPAGTGAVAPGQIFWTTAIPSSGTHTQGDRAINKSATVGNPKAWACTVTGSPGTWVSEGNL